MADDRKLSEEKRANLISELTEEILDTAASIAEPEEDNENLANMIQDIRERLSFEVNVLLNEAVTKLSPRKALERIAEVPKRTFQRFGINFRAQHTLMFVSVIILIITGMPLKFPQLGISKFIIVDLMGGLENSTLVHRVGAVGLIIVGVWHLGYIAFSRVGRRDFFLMIPRPRDIRDFFRTLLFFFGRRASGPKFGRFSFIEKFDYWAVYWGMVIMIGSGIIMWFKEWFPKYLYDIGREAHSDEGLLATLAIVIWHFYNVHLNPDVFPMSWVWWHGKLNEDEMKHHHPLEYAEIVEAESREIIEEKDRVADTGSGDA
ncbi:MAG: cytochrome b/b6 domain-containing protein [Candidatus Zixiibacteriota bacterium]|nr:MAG: cytochrome b/b6 domain-containing protein [candidate division Zixibacteria bacterium]